MRFAFRASDGLSRSYAPGRTLNDAGQKPAWETCGGTDCRSTPDLLEARFWPINKRDRFGSDKGVYRDQSGGIRISVTYHTRQAFSETMGCPALQPNASWKAAEFCTAPFTRQRPGE